MEEPVGAEKVRDWYSRPEVQDLYAAFATSAILSGLRDAYASFVAARVAVGEELVLLELGVGPGHQFDRLFAEVKPLRLSALKIIGVDLCRSYLDEAAARIEQLSEDARFPVHFHAIAASFSDLASIRLPWPPHLIASTLALHHLQWEEKGLLFEKVRGSGARAFFIGEVDSLLDRRLGEPDHGRREGRKLYDSVFAAVSQEAGLTPEVADQVNRFFFRPEATSVASRPYEQRGEYYLPGEEWRRLLSRAGFSRTDVRETFRSRDGGYRLVAVTGDHKA